MGFWDYFTQFKKDVEPELVRDKEESFVPLEINDAYFTNPTGGFQQTTLNVTGNGSFDEVSRINAWRGLAKCPEISWAIGEICNDAVILDYQEYPCQLTVDDDSELSKNITEKLSAEFKEILRIMNFKRNGVELFKQFYIDGKVYYHAVLDQNNNKQGITSIRWIDPRNMKRVVEFKEQENSNGIRINVVSDDYYMYSASFGHKTSSYSNAAQYVGSTSSQIIKVHPESIAYANSGIFEERGDGTSFSLSFLDASLKAYNMMSALEQAMTIYRIARAPERRVFYVDVGTLRNEKANQYLNSVMSKFKRKITFDSTTGKLNSENNELGIMDDYWLPRTEGGRGTEVTTLQSGSSWNDMNDLEWFQKKVLRGLNIPFGRFNSETLFSSGRSMEITREEVKFSKFITTLRAKYSQSLIQLLKVQVISKGIMSIDEYERIVGGLNVKWKTDAYWDELMFNEMWQTRLNLLNQFDSVANKHVSNDWLAKNVLQMTEEEIKEQRKQIELETKDKIYNPLEPEDGS